MYLKLKKDLVKTLLELGVNKDEMSIISKTPDYYHPGISGSIYTKDKKNIFGLFW